MDELGGFEPTDTTGFIQIESIRIKKSVFTLSTPKNSRPNPDNHRWAQSNIRKGEAGVEPKDVYRVRV